MQQANPRQVAPTDDMPIQPTGSDRSTVKTSAPPKHPSFSPEEAITALAQHGLNGAAVIAASIVEAATLRRAKEAADAVELTFLQRVLHGHEAGQLSQRDLALIYQQYRSVARSGHGARWDSVIPFTRIMIENHMYSEPDPDGRWRGPWPLAWGTSIPARGVSVVYRLYDAHGLLC